MDISKELKLDNIRAGIGGLDDRENEIGNQINDNADKRFGANVTIISVVIEDSGKQ